MGAAGALKLPVATDVAAVGLGYVSGVWPDRLECSGLVRHRTTTHWLLTLGALVAAAAYGVWQFLPEAAVPVTLGLSAGLFGHTLADACTPHGSPLLGPFYARPVRLLPRRACIRTGSGRERALALCVALGLAVYCARLAGLI